MYFMLNRLCRMTLILVYYFEVKKCIPQIMILFISPFLDFLKYFFINISMNPWKTEKKYLYT